MKVLFEDENLLAVRKRTGWAVHPSWLVRKRMTVLTELERTRGEKLYPAHRLDSATSGVLLFSRNVQTARLVGMLFREGKVKKSYLAILRGYVPESGRIERWLEVPKCYKVAQHSDDEDDESFVPREVREPDPTKEKLPHVTTYERLATAEVQHAVGRYATARYSLVRATPETGRLHQIRRHFSGIAHPIIGDKMHGDRDHNRFFANTLQADRLMLHAQELHLPHPHTGAPLKIWCTSDWAFKHAVEQVFTAVRVSEMHQTPLPPPAALFSDTAHPAHT